MENPNASKIMKLLNGQTNYGKNINWELSGRGVTSVLDENKKPAFKAIVRSESPHGKLSKDLEDFLPEGVRFPVCKNLDDATKGALRVLQRDDVQAKLKKMKKNGVKEKPVPMTRDQQERLKKPKKNDPFSNPMFNPIE